MSNTLPSEIIKDLLVADGYTFGGIADWAVYIGYKPPEPKNIIVLSDTPGASPDPKWRIDYPTVQADIRCNTSSYKVGSNHMRRIKELCLGITPYNHGNDRVVSVSLLGEPGYAGLDEEGMAVFVVNIQMILMPEGNTGDHREDLPA